jgi:hypothetical protein
MTTVVLLVQQQIDHILGRSLYKLTLPDLLHSPLLHLCAITFSSHSCYSSITIIGLDSTYKQKHAVFGFLSLAYLAQNYDLHFHPLLRVLFSHKEM